MTKQHSVNFYWSEFVLRFSFTVRLFFELLTV